MAQPVAIRTALLRLGFTNDASIFLTEEQGMDMLNVWLMLSDDRVRELCKVVRCPGGTIDNPDAGDEGQADVIPNPGLKVSVIAEDNLKMACYYM